MDQKIAVLGAGSWGTALANLLADNGAKVTLWGRSQLQCETMAEVKENIRYLPGVTLSEKLQITYDLPRALQKCQVLVLAIPSHGIREISRKIRTYLPEDVILVNTAKGFEPDSFMRLTEVLKEELPQIPTEQITVLSGPSHAEEVGKKLPTAVVVAAPEKSNGEIIQDIFMSPYFRVYLNLDMIGVEISGALKNVIALGTGISDGLGFGDNTRAAIITRGLAEISRLGMAMGAEIQTFAGLAGLGDLVVTCTSMYSRNRRAGIQIGEGKPLCQVLKDMGMVVEGVNTTRAAFNLANKYVVDMPITREMYTVLFNQKGPLEAVNSLMTRTKTHEGEKDAFGLNFQS